MFLVKCRRWFEENDSKRNETTLDSEIHRICTKNTTFYSETNVWISDHILYMKISNIFFRLKKRNVFDETSWRFKQISNNCRFIILGFIYIIMINRDVEIYRVWGSVSSSFTKIAKCVSQDCVMLCVKYATIENMCKELSIYILKKGEWIPIMQIWDLHLTREKISFLP